jgi:hypothetical protein
MVDDRDLLLANYAVIIVWWVYGLQVKAAYPNFVAPRMHRVGTFLVDAPVTFFVILYLTRRWGWKIALASAAIGTASAPMIFEFPFDLIIMWGSNPPIPGHPMLYRQLLFGSLFLWEFTTVSLLTLLPSMRVTSYAAYAVAGMSAVFAVWAVFGFAFPSEPLPLVLNIISKVLCFVAVIMLFVWKPDYASFAHPGEGEHPKTSEHDRSSDADRLHREPVGELVPEKYRRDIGEHHAERCAGDDRVELLEPGGEADRRDLRLVTDLGEEERDQGRDKGTEAADRLRLLLILVRKQRPHGDAQEGNPEYPAHPRSIEEVAGQCPGKSGSGMVGDRGEEDAEDDRYGSVKPGGEDHREDLRLVADLGETDDHRRDEEGFHGRAIRGRVQDNFSIAPSTRPG